MNIQKLTLKVELVKARVDILKLKADEYTWSCYVPDPVKAQLEKTLVEIDAALEELERPPKKPEPTPEPSGGYRPRGAVL